MLPLCSGSHDEDCEDDYDHDKEEDDNDYDHDKEEDDDDYDQDKEEDDDENDHDKEEDDDSPPADYSASTLKLAVYQELSLLDDLYLICLYPNKLVVHHD